MASAGKKCVPWLHVFTFISIGMLLPKFSRVVAGTEPTTVPSSRSLEQVLADTARSVVQVVSLNDEHKEVRLGSGFFVSADGLLCTNLHVIEGAKHGLIRYPNGAEYNVIGVGGVDIANDLVLLKVDVKPKAALPLAAGKAPAAGTKVFAIGNPQGLANSISEGVISSVRRDDLGENLVQTTAAISPGSSGGPLVTPEGTLVGVTTLYLRVGQNLNFAVPATRVSEMMARWQHSPDFVSDAEMEVWQSIKLDAFATDEITGYGENPPHPPERTLQAAALNDDVPGIDAMLKAGASIDAGRGKYDWTALHWAAWKGNDRAIKALTDRGASLNPVDTSGMTPLHLAAMRGQLEAIKVLVGRKADIRAEDKWRTTPLFMAADNGSAVAALLLLQAGADVNARNAHGRTPLHGALYHPDVVFLLREWKADVSIKDSNGHTALEDAETFQSLGFKPDPLAIEQGLNDARQGEVLTDTIKMLKR